MNLSRFFEHWGIVENPFRGEEARQDPVFMRLGQTGGGMGAGTVARVSDGDNEGGAAMGGTAIGGGVAGAGADVSGVLPRTTHSDFEKIAGDFDRPSTAIVFGEKGSGKTAIRMQLGQRIAAYNAQHPDAKCLLIEYDELNPVLDRFYERMSGDRKSTLPDVLKKFRLVDHIDAILGVVVPRIVDGLVREGAGGASAGDGRQGAGGAAAVKSESAGLEIGVEARKAMRRLDVGLRRDLLLLQVVYDEADRAEERSRRLRRRLRLPLSKWVIAWDLLAFVGWAPAVAMLVWGQTEILEWKLTVGGYLLLGLLGLWLLVLLKRFAWDRLDWLRLGHKLRRQLRVSARGDRSYAGSLKQFDAVLRDHTALPVTDSDEQRYAMIERLRRVLRPLGYASLIVVIDRVDEPTLISGDPDRMRAFIWPMLNNKFLQQPGLGIKMLLPIELRHALFRESAAFFQEARLDKQNLIEKLSWTGAMLYDLCNARLQACANLAMHPTEPGKPVTLLELFAEDVTRQDLVEALDQMHQPRDAFKLLYQCLTEHCSNVTEDQAQWRIPRLILETVKKGQAERVRQLYRGVRPA
ncbi:MAG: hypothetical protein H7Y88_11495 [Phycisphaerales bacterium]|nr:hypothetical protein [Phycisphaerales bacterium]